MNKTTTQIGLGIAMGAGIGTAAVGIAIGVVIGSSLRSSDCAECEVVHKTHQAEGR